MWKRETMAVELSCPEMARWRALFDGALPPEEGKAWDWDRTWRARRSK